MILVDVNLLLYATMDSHPRHERARGWLEEKLNGVTGVGLPWSSLLGFVRIASNSRVFRRPMSVETAWGYVEEWLALPPVFVPEPAERHAEILRKLLPEAGRAELVPDARLAALAIEYGLTLQTTDRDFSRFTGLKWEDPLAAPPPRAG